MSFVCLASMAKYSMTATHTTSGYAWCGLLFRWTSMNSLGSRYPSSAKRVLSHPTRVAGSITSEPAVLSHSAARSKIVALPAPDASDNPL